MITPAEKQFQKAMEEACQALNDMAREACSRTSTHEVWHYISTANKLQSVLRTIKRWIEYK